MEEIIKKYAAKLVKNGLAEEGLPLVGAMDDEILWNRRDKSCNIMEKVFNRLNISSLIFSEPSEPYKSIIDYLAYKNKGVIYPEDCETRTFLHDLPIADSLNESVLVAALKQRKCVIVKGMGIVTIGAVNSEQAFVVFSSVCFACFVKFFSDYLNDAKKGHITNQQRKIYNNVKGYLKPVRRFDNSLTKGPFQNQDEVYSAIIEAGRRVVEYRLVDSFFGNISCFFNGIFYISQTGSSLDELQGTIDPCPMDGSSSVGITASSEFSAHREIVLKTGCSTILHGHPLFSVIISMDCDIDGCKNKDVCHSRCTRKRYFNNIPIVSGEVGTGPFGLCNTVPRVMEKNSGVMVYGHGVFATGADDFNEAFSCMLDIENACRKEYFKRIEEAVNKSLFK